MEKVKLLIELDKDDYKRVMMFPNALNSLHCQAIRNGTPYNPSGDCISREALKKKLQARHDNGEEDFDKGYNIGIEAAIELLDNAPTAEPERPQGQWVYRTDIAFHTCSKCNGIGYIRDRFCKHCGAAMQNAQRDAE